MEGRNGSSIRLSSGHLFNAPKRNQSESTFKANLQLPMLQKRTQLSIERRSEELDSQTPIPTSMLPTEKGRSEEQVRAGLSFFQKLKKINSKLTFGVKIAKPLIFFTNLRLSKESQFEKWRNNVINNVFYNTEEHFGQSLTIDFDRSINSQLMFRLAFSETYLESDNTMRTSIGPMIFHTLSTHRRLTYSLKLNASNRPTYSLNEYYLGALFRQNLNGEFLFFEISPFVTWKRALNFHAERAIYAKIEVIFGEN